MQKSSSGRSQSMISQPVSPTAVRRTFSGSSSPSNGRRATVTSARGLANNMVTSMTIDEMRVLHNKAKSEAEAKKTELRLVLASRYRELVGSSDEVIKMKERAQELQDLVQNLPKLLEKLQNNLQPEEESKTEIEPVDPKLLIRRELTKLPRLIHRTIYQKDVYAATAHLIRLFEIISSATDRYELANQYASNAGSTTKIEMDAQLELQTRMVFLQMEKLPDKLSRMSKAILCRSASYGSLNPVSGAHQTAAALASLYALKCDDLLSVYFESKAKLLGELLKDLNTGDAEQILSKIVSILQYDIVVIPFQVFLLKALPGEGNWQPMVNSLPDFEKSFIQGKCSKFLSTHLPLIRSKVKTVLGTIAGTTASALGQIRQSLYDKTDGVVSVKYLSEHAVCTWDEAVSAVVDIRSVLNSADAATATQDRFSLWGALFSSTFSSLVHSLLTTSFQSVHTSVVTTLRESLANAPPLCAILPHEAYRNTLKIASDLDKSLLKVSADAHELLVHAEEREESERRLRQSLYVQTCEIMGRLICELRRMALSDEHSDGKRELIIGRLCYLLKFRLTSLKTLLAPESSPASMHSTGGMISYVDLQSAFELADDNEDGLVSFNEAILAVESSFAGTPFNGGEMVRETLLLSPDSKQSGTVSLSELALLTARGLRHDKAGMKSALGNVQFSLDHIVNRCLLKWAHSALSSFGKVLDGKLRDFCFTASSCPEEEWQRLFLKDSAKCKGVSPHVVGFLLDVSSSLNQNTCPADSLSPVPSNEYAAGLGIEESDDSLPTLMDLMRSALLKESFKIFLSVLNSSIGAETASRLSQMCPSALKQFFVDTSFVEASYLQDNTVEFKADSKDKILLKNIVASVGSASPDVAQELHQHVSESSDLLLSPLFGRSTSTSVSPAGEILGVSDGGDHTLFAPLTSSRRFALLPVQADRTLSDIQLRGKYAKEQEESADTQQTSSGNVISGGFGFLSSMLKTGKK